MILMRRAPTRKGNLVDARRAYKKIKIKKIIEWENELKEGGENIV